MSFEGIMSWAIISIFLCFLKPGGIVFAIYGWIVLLGNLFVDYMKRGGKIYISTGSSNVTTKQSTNSTQKTQNEPKLEKILGEIVNSTQYDYARKGSSNYNNWTSVNGTMREVHDNVIYLGQNDDK